LACAVITLVATEALAGTGLSVADTAATAGLEVSVSTVSVVSGRMELVSIGSGGVHIEASIEVVIQDDLLARDVLLGLRHDGAVGVQLLLGPDLGDAVHVQVGRIHAVFVCSKIVSASWNSFTFIGDSRVHSEEHSPVALVEAVSGTVGSDRSGLARHVSEISAACSEGIT